MNLTRIVLALTALALFIPLTGCNTVSGVGRDLQILGSKMEGGADQVQHRASGSNY